MHERNHAGPGCKDSPQVRDASRPQRGGKRICQRGHLRQLTLVERGRAGDDLVPRLREWPVVLKRRLDRPERPEQRVERSESVGRVGYRGRQGRSQPGLAIEQDLALVGEVTEEGVGALDRPGARWPSIPSCYAMTGWRRTESGRPAANIRFSTATPMVASVCWAAKPRARRRGPISAL